VNPRPFTSIFDCSFKVLDRFQAFPGGFERTLTSLFIVMLGCESEKGMGQVQFRQEKLDQSLLRVLMNFLVRWLRHASGTLERQLYFGPNSQTRRGLCQTAGETSGPNDPSNGLDWPADGYWDQGLAVAGERYPRPDRIDTPRPCPL